MNRDLDWTLILFLHYCRENRAANNQFALLLFLGIDGHAPKGQKGVPNFGSQGGSRNSQNRVRQGGFHNFQDMELLQYC